MNSPEQLSDFVAKRIGVGRVQPGALYFYTPFYLVRQPLPTREQLAQSLLADAEFQSLKLGNWLNSPSGEAIAQIVAEVVPSTLQPEFGLIVDGLKLAADLQKTNGRAQIGVGSLVLLFAGLVVREGLKAAA
ncbi:MAG: hypothetical protein ACYDC5_07510 [Candidatus Dormibacteria bacterium]